MARMNPEIASYDTFNIYENKISIVRTVDSEKTQEEIQLEADLRAMTEEKRQADERLRKIKQAEERKKERLYQIKTERHAARLDSQKKAKQETELQVEMEALKGENNKLKQQVEVLREEVASEREELELLRRKYPDKKREKDEEIQDLMQRIKCLEDDIQQREQDKLQSVQSGREADLQTELKVLRTQNELQSKSLMELKANFQHITSLSTVQQMTIDSLQMINKSLQDKITAGQQIAVETQLRQLDELHSLTEETRQLKQTLTTQHQYQHQQQQQTAAEEHHQGKRCSNSLTSCLL